MPNHNTQHNPPLQPAADLQHDAGSPTQNTPKHTPGPWTLHHSYPQFDTEPRSCDAVYPGYVYWTAKIASGTMIIGEAGFDSGSEGGWPSVTSPEEGRANVCLMLAAPEMLEALRRVECFLKTQDIEEGEDFLSDETTFDLIHELLASTRAAIAKAVTHV